MSRACTETFHGSYATEDVEFLLKRIDMAPTPVEEKERLIQSGQCHYSEMIGVERAPSERYLTLFQQAMAANGPRFARDLASLAKAIAADPTPVVLVSLARAGTPVGVLLRRALVALHRQVTHFSISIIRDRGIDRNALSAIVERHRDARIFFVDGWTGKGAIAQELAVTIGEFNREHGCSLPLELTVVADLAGRAGLAATADDYLIPSSILNAVVSGLVSRTILNCDYIGPEDFHGCLYYGELEAADLSRSFVDSITELMLPALHDPALEAATWGMEKRRWLQEKSDRFVEDLLEEFQLTDRNRVKPGVGESTRSLLRRVPDLLLLRDGSAPEVQHLVYLAEQRNVPIETRADLPYNAAVLIKTLGE